MIRLFERFGDDPTIGVTCEQFEEVLHDPFVKSWLAAMGLSMHDVPRLFALMDDGNGKLNAQELTEGVNRLKGQARGLDMVLALSDIKTVLFEIEALKEALLPAMGNSMGGFSADRLSASQPVPTLFATSLHSSEPEREYILQTRV